MVLNAVLLLDHVMSPNKYHCLYQQLFRFIILFAFIQCDGSTNNCPANAFQSSSSVCRPVAGACDVAEACSGSSASCPTDSYVFSSLFIKVLLITLATIRFHPSSVTCRPATDVCDAPEQVIYYSFIEIEIDLFL